MKQRENFGQFPNDDGSKNSGSSFVSILKSYLIYRSARKLIVLAFVLGVFFLLALVAIAAMIFGR